MMGNEKQKDKIERTSDDWFVGGVAGLTASALAAYGCINLQLRSVGIEGFAGVTRIKIDAMQTITDNFLNKLPLNINIERSNNAIQADYVLKNIDSLKEPNDWTKLIVMGTLVATTIFVSGLAAKTHHEKTASEPPKTNIDSATATRWQQLKKSQHEL